MEEGRSDIKILIGKPTEKTHLARRGRKWENNITIDLELDINTGNWVDLPHDGDYWRALMNAALNHLIP